MNADAKASGNAKIGAKVRKAVFPVAGLGTRFLPATKAMPKEMLTVVDRPVIQIVVDEAREAGIEHFVFVTGRNKGVIEDHFDKPYELYETLSARGKSAELDVIEADLPQPGQTSFTRQQEPRGLGHAVWCARDIVGDEPFALLLPDMVMAGARETCLSSLMRAYNTHGGNALALMEVPREETGSYGIVGGDQAGDGIVAIREMIEKPDPAHAPSNLAISGRYILQPEIFDILEDQGVGTGGEIQLTDALIRLLAEQPFHGVMFEGETFDCGSKLGFLMANITTALKAPEFGDQLRANLEKLLAEK